MDPIYVPTRVATEAPDAVADAANALGRRKPTKVPVTPELFVQISTRVASKAKSCALASNCIRIFVMAFPEPELIKNA
jgi:hypothetical protein